MASAETLDDEITALKAELSKEQKKYEKAEEEDRADLVCAYASTISGLRNQIASLENQRPRASSQKRRKISECFPYPKKEMELKSLVFRDDQNVDRLVYYFIMKKFPPMSSFNIRIPCIVVRDCYRDMYTWLKEKILSCAPGKHFAISGNPGVGKSCFYLYCIFQLIKEDFCNEHNKKLLLNAGSEYWILDGDSFHDIEFSNELKRDESIIRLIDGDSDRLGEQWYATSVLFSSPKVHGDRNYNTFKKEQYPTLYMPVWSQVELENANALFRTLNPILNVEDLHKRFSLVGGIARYVLDSTKPYKTLKGEVMEAIEKSDAKTLCKYVNTHEPTSGGASSWWLLKIEPIHIEEGWTNPSVEFASRKISIMILKSFKDKYLQKLKSFAIENAKDPSSGSYRGTIFEMLFIKRVLTISSPLVKEARSLSPATDNMQFVLQKGKYKHVRGYDNIPMPHAPFYYFSKTVNTSSIDGMYFHSDAVYLLQLTITPEHPVKNEALKHIFRNLTQNLCVPHNKVFLIFVVPNKMFKKRWKKEQDLVSSDGRPIKCGRVPIKQYVIGLDWDEI